MSNNVLTYLSLITSAHQSQPNFVATVAFSVGVSVQLQSLLTSMMADAASDGVFDLDTPPVGDQLNIIGQWVGASREVLIPGVDVYFQWDGANPNVGWDQGTWAPLGSPGVLVTLPDDAYLTLVKATIAANNWDGTLGNFYEVIEQFFSDFTILVVDHLDMSYDLGIISLTGQPLDPLTLALFTGGYIKLKPEGVGVTEYFTNADNNPIFAWDIVNSSLGGWDTSSWAKILTI